MGRALVVGLLFISFSDARGLASQPPWDLARLREAVDNFSPSGTLEEFLEAYIVPGHFDLIFVHESGSIQYADEITPRILFVSPDNALTLAIATYRGGLGWEGIEAIEFKPKNPNPFTFAEIVFPSALPFHREDLKGVSWNGFGPPELRCAGCHRSEFGRPMAPIFRNEGDGGIWGGHGVWTDETLKQWEDFKRNAHGNPRHKLFSEQIDKETPEHLAEKVQNYFSSLTKFEP